MTTECDYWDWREDEECLRFECVGEAIAAYLESTDEPKPEITLYGYTRRTIDDIDLNPEVICELIYERLDDEYHHCDADVQSPSESVLAAATALCDEIRKAYRVSLCELETTITVNTTTGEEVSV